tara:strand:- start:421 stop:2559 length:2139 start_codon:yes stop_codon:yes gene_type:complete
MAENVISPGVFLNENVPVTTEAPIIPAGAAIIGPTVLGPKNIPTIVTTYSEYKQRFGSTYVASGSTFSFLTSISAQKFFQNGGQRLLVTKVASGSFTAASSSTIQNNQTDTAQLSATGSFTVETVFADGEEVRFTQGGIQYRFIASANPIPQDVETGTEQLYFFSTGSSANASSTNFATKLNDSLSGSSASASKDLLTATSAGGSAVVVISGSAAFGGTALNGVQFETGSGDSFISILTLAGGVGGVGSNAFTLKTLSQGVVMNSSGSETSAGVLSNGSRDNLRWEITDANTSSGDFTLTIRRGDDRQGDKVVLETFRGVNLDPRSPNYIARRVGSQFKALEGTGTSAYIAVNGEYPNISKYAFVSNVAATTLDYLDEAGNLRINAASESVPVNQSGSFGGAIGDILLGDPSANSYENITSGVTQGIKATDYADVIAVLRDKDAYPYNVISTPGLIYSETLHATQLDSLITHIETRADAIIPIDLRNYGATVEQAVTTATSLNTSYAAAYWPWVKVRDNDLAKDVWAPASTLIPAVYAANDAVADAWFAPAGFNRGGLPGVVNTERGLKRSLRDTLYAAKVNPIATFPNAGIVVYGQKTLQSKASATDRVNVRRLLITLKDFIGQVSQNLIFEPNTVATRNSFLSVVNPFLETVQQRQGLFAFKVVMDASNNGPNVIDRNELRGTIFLQPTKTAEFIVLDFNVLPTGAEFPG